MTGTAVVTVTEVCNGLSVREMTHSGGTGYMPEPKSSHRLGIYGVLDRSGHKYTADELIEFTSHLRDKRRRDPYGFTVCQMIASRYAPEIPNQCEVITVHIGTLLEDGYSLSATMDSVLFESIIHASDGISIGGLALKPNLDRDLFPYGFGYFRPRQPIS